MSDVITCPHCQYVNEALDYEDCDIDFTVLTCVSCEKDFNMSRTITIDYDTWID